MIFSMIFSDDIAGLLLTPAQTVLTDEDHLITMFAILNVDSHVLFQFF